MISDATLAIDDLLAEEAERIARRDWLRDLVAESDRLLERLERCNLAGQAETPKALRRRLMTLSRMALGEELTDTDQVQPALELVYRVQDELFDRLHPERAPLRAREREEAREDG